MIQLDSGPRWRVDKFLSRLYVIRIGPIPIAIYSDIGHTREQQFFSIHGNNRVCSYACKNFERPYVGTYGR